MLGRCSASDAQRRFTRPPAAVVPVLAFCALLVLACPACGRTKKSAAPSGDAAGSTGSDAVGGAGSSTNPGTGGSGNASTTEATSTSAAGTGGSGNGSGGNGAVDGGGGAAAGAGGGGGETNPDDVSYSEWSTCSDSACMCDGVTNCDAVQWDQAFGLGSEGYTVCGTQSENCVIAAFTEMEQSVTTYRCLVPLGASRCNNGQFSFEAIAADCARAASTDPPAYPCP